MAGPTAQSETGPETVIHASAVSLGGRAVLIMGASGSGKSALALELMALGAGLVADDRTLLRPDGPGVIASAPPRLAGLIEARFVGLLNADAAPPAPVALAIDLSRDETERLPPRRSLTLCGRSVPLLRRVAQPYFPAAIVQYLTAGRAE
ncbi:HPr kinase/phosphorylase [Rhodovulum iodosum]|uniref:HPr kinase/phosphorylase n=1 Tax=Rhodovulum iodosum TaxID=68291 RepID=A0ABV3XSX3_9RHOB|nr:HPr kinase/phosphatase C-terminal domain-containing protein [Rhodovulum robiginosum]RSK39640.1 serine kinase [Rhodovulum robiginosum]